MASVVTVGTTIEGREIYGISITGTGDVSTKPAFLMNACQHARFAFSLIIINYLSITSSLILYID